MENDGVERIWDIRLEIKLVTRDSYDPTDSSESNYTKFVINKSKSQ
jgi:hypothetical protein